MQQLYIKTVTIHYLGPWIDNHFRFKKNNLIFGITEEEGNLDLIDILRAIKDIRKFHKIDLKYLHQDLKKNIDFNYHKFLLKITYFNSKKETYIKINKNLKIDYKESVNFNLISRVYIKFIEKAEEIDQILKDLETRKERINFIKNRIIVFLKVENLLKESKIEKLLDFSYKFSGQTFFSTISPKVIVHAMNKFDTRLLDVFYMVDHVEKNLKPNLLQQLAEYTGEKIRKKILFVEGISDRLILEAIAKRNKIKDLVIIDTGGIANINFEAIAKLNNFLNAKALIDYDNEKGRISNRLIHVLKRRAIEWYLDQNILHKNNLNDFKMSSHNKILMAENFKNTYFKSKNYKQLEFEVLNLYNSF